MSLSMKRVMQRLSDGEFRAADGSLSMKREFCETPQGNPMAGRWVVRDSTGTLVDFDQYANDLAERHGLALFDQGKPRIEASKARMTGLAH
ncbi:putative molybdenum carrier protein [Massilia aurea]|uniref:putative molybdenum carrier protein n=1 Tax=Massilia aurea TaxID=373040 RepID=UPI00216366F3|nr:putative molybdenum carrier protein [Massilia aurea]MCS0709980.1 putative molybdenum carrier protein [Massilia aurea]